MSAYTGFKLELFNAKGLQHKCSYKSFEEATWAAANLTRREPGYFIVSISPGDAPRPASTMEEWIAAGNTTD